MGQPVGGSGDAKLSPRIRSRDIALDGIAYRAPFQGGVWRDWEPLTEAVFSPTAGIAAAAAVSAARAAS